MSWSYPQFKDITVHLSKSTEPIEGDHAKLDPRSVLDLDVLQFAVYRALWEQEKGKLKTSNIYSEILLCLSTNNNIREAYSTFGGKPGEESLIIQLSKPEASLEVDWSCDMEQIKKYYGTTNKDAILGSLALRGV